MAEFTQHPTENKTPSLYQQVLAAGIEIDNHESDLYVPDTEQTRSLIEQYAMHPQNVKPFKSAIDGSKWLEIPFGFDPWWAARIG